MRFQPLIGDTLDDEINAALADVVIKTHSTQVGARVFPDSPGEMRPIAPYLHRGTRLPWQYQLVDRI